MDETIKEIEEWLRYQRQPLTKRWDTKVKEACGKFRQGIAKD